MNIFVLGGTGRTGRHVIDRALQRGHRVSALVRSRSRIAPQSGLRILAGDPRDRDALSSSLANHDAVISCLGQRSAADATLLRQSAGSLVAAMGEQRNTRLVVISQGLLFPSSALSVRLLRRFLARHVADSQAMEALICTSALDWTIVRPPYLTDGRTQRGYRLAVNGMPNGRFAMSRADLATALVDEVDTSAHVRAVIGVAAP